MPAAAIREEILKSGIISFARFMELALYCPETGYYETKKDIVGQRGDFITSVSTGPLFGQLLAFQFAEWLKEMRAAGPLSLVEAGAHGGQLAADILAWLQNHRPQLFDQIEYVILEPSSRRREWQQEGLAKFGNKVRWVSRFSEFTSACASTGEAEDKGDCNAGWQPAVSQVDNLRGGPADCQSAIQQAASLRYGILFSNELLDAFPVHRFGWDAAKQEWFEWGVALNGENICWVKIMQHAARITLPSSILNLPSSLLDVLPDNYVIESSPAAEKWWRDAAGALAQGKLMTIDYGHAADEMFTPARLHGTLRAYHRHRVTDDLLANPGEQDLTAHVNFAAIQQAGEAAGLRTEQFCTQPQFLTRILQRAVAEKTFAALDIKQARQFQTLTHPEHLGRAFRVVVQGR